MAAIISPSPKYLVPGAHSLAFGTSALEAAELRLSTAERWASSSATLLESARSQAEASRRELSDAREYLSKMKLGLGEDLNEVASSDNCNSPGERESERASTIEAAGTCNSTEETESEMVSTAGTLSTDGRGGILKKPRGDGKERKTKEGRRVSLADGRTIDTLSSEGTGVFGKLREGKEEATQKSPGSKVLDASPKCNDRCVSLESDRAVSTTSECEGCAEIEISGCGVPEVNGKYLRFDTGDDGVPDYSKIGYYEGKEAVFTVSRYQSDTGSKRWCITLSIPGRGRDEAKQYAFYVAFAPSFLMSPPKKNWMVMEGDHFLSPEYEGRGLDPCPAIEHESPVVRSVSRRKSHNSGMDSRGWKNKKDKGILGMQVVRSVTPARGAGRSISMPRLRGRSSSERRPRGSDRGGRDAVRRRG